MSSCGIDANAGLAGVIGGIGNLPGYGTDPSLSLPDFDTGLVVGVDPTTGLVEIIPSTGIDPIQIPWVLPYMPRTGDTAALVKKGSQWLAIGAISTRNYGGDLPNDGLNGAGTAARWSFESGTLAGWTTDGNITIGTGTADTYVFSDLNAPHGEYVASLEWSANLSANVDWFFTSPSVPVVPGQQWTSSLYTRSINDGFTASHSTEIIFWLEFLDSGGTSVDQSSTAGITFGSATSTFIPLKGSVGSVPSGATQMHIIVGFNITSGVNGSNGYFDFDDVQVRRV